LTRRREAAHDALMTDPLEGVDEVPVLLAGGGLVGLSTAMFLAQHGVASLAVEPLPICWAGRSS
jgi:heterodisulfide reductase subunit A-like polyferredoxin